MRSKWQVDPELILSLKCYQLRILPSNRNWETGLVFMAGTQCLAWNKVDTLWQRPVVLDIGIY